MEKTDKKLNTALVPKILKRLMKGFCLSSAVWFISTSQVYALNLIADEETEAFLGDIAKPIFQAAGVPFNRNNIFIVNDNSLNAFVSDGNYLFINTGTIINAGSKDEIAGVIAHETGHIMGGHILRQKLKNESLQQASLASLILAGTTAAATGRGDIAMAIALGGQSSTLNNFLQYRTEQERSADESAVKLLSANHQSPTGMLKFMKRLSKSNDMSGVEESPYFRTHPLSRDRILFLEKAVKESSYPETSSSSEQFERVKAKLTAYLDAPKNTFRRYPESNTSVPARYAQSIAYFKELSIDNAMDKIDELIRQEPQNPFFKELKAQIYMETGKITLAKSEYKKAWNLSPSAPQLQFSYAQAIIEDNPSAKELKTAINLLNKANILQPSAMTWMLLAKAYGQQGNQAYSNYAAAKYSLAIGNKDLAQRQAKAALEQPNLPQTLKLKLNDILSSLAALEANARAFDPIS